MQHHLIQSSTRSWDDLFRETAQRATELGPRLVAISHASDGSTGTVTLWSHPTAEGPKRWMRYWFVRSSMRPWQSLLDEAAQRAAQLAPGQLFGLSHSSDGGDGLVAVWYWVDHDPAEQKRRRGSVAISQTTGGALSEVD